APPPRLLARHPVGASGLGIDGHEFETGGDELQLRFLEMPLGAAVDRGRCYPVTNPDAIRVIREAAMLVPIR
ncbi:hypothetical protein, partial [Mesorhizobium sp.]|uniref:hypothetical protein n=1 Tax=Mesorhizobium sp. TaxID=1871066 RepID=UPI0025B93943